MTRINLIDPSLLDRRHLLAEYMELPRVFTLVSVRLMKGHDVDVQTVPEAYCLGTGHVKFFYNKLLFLNNRQLCIIKELRRYDYVLNFTSPLIRSYSHLPAYVWNDYTPTANALQLNIARLFERNNDHYAHLMSDILFQGY